MKWFELIRQVRLRDGDAARALPGRRQKIAPNMRDYVVKQLKETVIPHARAHLGRQVRHRPAAPVHARVGEGRGRPGLVLRSAKNRPPDRRLLRRGLLHRPDLHRVSRHAGGDVRYATLRRRSRSIRSARGGHADGDMGDEKYRLVVEGPPNWTNFREFWKMFTTRARWSSPRRTQVGGLYDFGFRHDPTAARVARRVPPGCYTNLEPAVAGRHDLPYIESSTQADGCSSTRSKELQQLLGRAAADDARGREAHRQAGGLHRDRPRRPALLRRRTSRTGGELLQMIKQRTVARPAGAGQAPDPAGGRWAETNDQRRGHRLGSTTTKAVVIDENQNVIGRGITNSARTTTPRRRSPSRRRWSAGSTRSATRWRRSAERRRSRRVPAAPGAISARAVSDRAARRPRERPASATGDGAVRRRWRAVGEALTSVRAITEPRHRRSSPQARSASRTSSATSPAASTSPTTGEPSPRRRGPATTTSCSTSSDRSIIEVENRVCRFRSGATCSLRSNAQPSPRCPRDHAALAGRGADQGILDTGWRRPHRRHRLRPRRRPSPRSTSVPRSSATAWART